MEQLSLSPVPHISEIGEEQSVAITHQKHPKTAMLYELSAH
jgi:hypothetical protein